MKETAEALTPRKRTLASLKELCNRDDFFAT